MTHISRIEAEALATAVAWLRPDWNQPGVLAALRDVAPTADKWDVYHAIGAIAADPTVKTPGFLKTKGAHWQRMDGSKPARRGDHNVPCVDHPTYDMPCPHLDHHGQMTLDEIAEAKAAVLAAAAAARTTPALRKPAPITEPTTRLEQVRALIPEETPDV